MLSLLSTLGGLLLSGLPKLLEYFQNKADIKVLKWVLNEKP